MAAIRIDGLTKRYGSGENSVLAVNDLDLHVKEGEVFGFLGPNGAGKSTTIDMILNFIEPTAGSIEILGLDAQRDSKAARERIGFLPDGYEVFQRLTAREHIEWVIEIRGSDDNPDEILAEVGLTHAADRQAGNYSKGMQQRLAFGMALIGDPDLLILDEPSSGLDPKGMQDMRDLLRRKAAEGVTVFFSSHILSEVEAVCDRIAILNQGELVIVDTLENLREDAGASIEVEVEIVPEGLNLENVDGVKSGRIDGDTIFITCENTRTKIAIVRHIDERASITDILSEDTSLEEMFNRYTTDGDGKDSQFSAVAEVDA